MNSREKKILVDLLRSHGYDVAVSGSGKYVVKDGDRQITVFSVSGSADWREKNNVRTQLRRGGFAWNPRQPHLTGRIGGGTRTPVAAR